MKQHKQNPKLLEILFKKRVLKSVLKEIVGLKNYDLRNWKKKVTFGNSGEEFVKIDLKSVVKSTNKEGKKDKQQEFIRPQQPIDESVYENADWQTKTTTPQKLVLEEFDRLFKPLNGATKKEKKLEKDLLVKKRNKEFLNFKI